MGFQSAIGSELLTTELFTTVSEAQILAHPGQRTNEVPSGQISSSSGNHRYSSVVDLFKGSGQENQPCYAGLCQTANSLLMQSARPSCGYNEQNSPLLNTACGSVQPPVSLKRPRLSRNGGIASHREDG